MGIGKRNEFRSTTDGHASLNGIGFKTLKGGCIRVKTPLSLEDARRLVAEFVIYYNTVRLHSAIAYVTPADKLAGRADAIWAARREKLATASARRRAKTEEKEIARPQSSEVH